ncbi:MAG TPA: DUF4391 domain-containing protein [Candidatus Eisenbacteria bacterium]|nr:DUF4391 domain-containing protein [Candidatus Eisenbacteria bacterium]
MTAADVITALALPPESRVDQRVPKKLLVEHGAPTAADKRQINDGIEELLWVAALKPATVGVPEYRDAVREVLEIAVLSLALRPEAKAARLVELIHRAIPYPVFLVFQQSNNIGLSLASKRLAQNEAGRMVLDEAPVSCSLEASTPSADWLPGLSLASQPRANLLALYDGWIACLEALLAAKITGKIVLNADPALQKTRRHALAEHVRLQDVTVALRAQAAKEKQVARRVDLNLEIQRFEAQLGRIREDL